jgi:hypothetical protein
MHVIAHLLGRLIGLRIINHFDMKLVAKHLGSIIRVMSQFHPGPGCLRVVHGSLCVGSGNWFHMINPSPMVPHSQLYLSGCDAVLSPGYIEQAVAYRCSRVGAITGDGSSLRRLDLTLVLAVLEIYGLNGPAKLTDFGIELSYGLVKSAKPRDMNTHL